MRVCLPTIDNQGPDGLPSAHFGSSPFFTFFDLETGDWEAVDNSSIGHAHGACRPLDLVTSRPVDAVICRGLGGGAFNRLQQEGIKIYLAREPDVSGCLNAFREGQLRELAEAEVCGGRQDHGQGQGRGRGRGRGHGQGGRRGGNPDTTVPAKGDF